MFGYTSNVCFTSALHLHRNLTCWFRFLLSGQINNSYLFCLLYWCYSCFAALATVRKTLGLHMKKSSFGKYFQENMFFTSACAVSVLGIVIHVAKLKNLWVSLLMLYVIRTVFNRKEAEMSNLRKLTFLLSRCYFKHFCILIIVGYFFFNT